MQWRIHGYENGRADLGALDSRAKPQKLSIMFTESQSCAHYAQFLATGQDIIPKVYPITYAIVRTWVRLVAKRASKRRPQTSPKVAQLIASSKFTVIRPGHVSQHLLSSR